MNGHYRLEAKSHLSPCYINKVLLAHSHVICLCVVYGCFRAKRAQLSVVIGALWFTVLKVLSGPFTEKFDGFCSGSQTGMERVCLRESHFCMVVKNMGLESDKPVLASWPCYLRVIRPCILFHLSESHQRNRNDDK